MAFDKNSCPQVSPRALGFVAAAYCIFVVYSVITSFERPTQNYHAIISYDLIYWTSLGAVGYLLCFGGTFEWRLDRSLPWLALAACILVSAILAADPWGVWERVRLYYAIAMLGFVLRAWFGKADDSIVPLVLSAIGVVHVAILMLVMMAVPNASPVDRYDQLWIPYHSHIRHVAYHGMIAACAGMTVGLLGGPLRFLGLIVAAVSLFGIAYFGARGALAGWLVYAFIITVLLPRRLVTIASCVVVLALAFLAATAVGREFAASPFNGSLVERSTSLEAVADSSERVRIWGEALTAIGENPVFGHGPEGYLNSRCCYPGTSQPHNVAIQILLEFGALGLAVVCWLLWRTFGRETHLFWTSRGTGEIDRSQALLFGMLGGIAAYSFLDGLFYHVVPLTLFAIIAALHASRAKGQ